MTKSGHYDKICIDCGSPCTGLRCQNCAAFSRLGVPRIGKSFESNLQKTLKNEANLMKLMLKGWNTQ